MHYTAVFADVLGFAAIVEQHDDLTGITPSLLSAQPLHRLVDQILSHGHGPLAARFAAFHRSLEADVEVFHRQHNLRLLSFSDSAFIVFEDAAVAVKFAGRLLRNLVQVEVPTRVGVGTGSFAALRFRTDSSPTYNVHTSQFLGQAIVRAARAERCGLSGMRAFVHPSTAALLTLPDHALIGVPDADVLWGISSELNYVSPFFSDGVRILSPDAQVMSERVPDLFASVASMQVSAGPDAQRHYSATKAALTRMYDALGYPVPDGGPSKSLP